MDYTVNTINGPTGRSGPRERACVRLIKTFGAEAEYLIPRLKELLGAEADAIIEQIKASDTAKEMITIEDVKKKQ